jgi:hypothetical protein
MEVRLNYNQKTVLFEMSKLTACDRHLSNKSNLVQIHAHASANNAHQHVHTTAQITELQHLAGMTNRISYADAEMHTKAWKQFTASTEWGPWRSTWPTAT